MRRIQSKKPALAARTRAHSLDLRAPVVTPRQERARPVPAVRQKSRTSPATIDPRAAAGPTRFSLSLLCSGTSPSARVPERHQSQDRLPESPDTHRPQPKPSRATSKFRSGGRQVFSNPAAPARRTQWTRAQRRARVILSRRDRMRTVAPKPLPSQLMTS